MKRAAIYSFLGILLCRAAVPLSATPGETALNFLKIEVGARALGSGGAFSAVADDASAAYWNPAGLLQLRHQQLSVMHTAWLEGINYQFFSYVQPTRGAGTLAASVYYLSVNDIPTYDNSGARLASAAGASDLALALSYARPVAGVDFGVNAKIIRETLENDSTLAYAADLGLLYRLGTGSSPTGWLGRELSLALSIQNLGPGVRFGSEEDPLPLNYRFGAAQDFFQDSLTVSCDANLPVDDELSVNAGLDYRITEWISLRAGYRFKSNRPQYDVQPGFTGGIGLGNEYISVDYAFVPYSDLGNAHRIGLNYRFGRAYDRYVLESKIRGHLRDGRDAYRRKDFVSAYGAFNRVLFIDPVNAEVKEYLSGITAKIDGVKAEKYLQAAKRLIREEQFIEAHELLDAILRLFPDHTEAKESFAQIRSALEQQKAMRAQSMFNQGLEFYKHKQYQDAYTLWEKVLLVNPDHAGTKEYLPLAKRELDAIVDRKKKAEQERRLKEFTARFKEAARFYGERRWERARQAFEETGRLFPEQELRDVERHLVEINNHVAEDHYRKGLKYYTDKNLPEAIKLWDEALRLNPKHREAAESLAKARAELTEINRAKAEDFYRQGLKEYDQGNVIAAFDLWEKAAALDPENAKVKNNLNRAKEELKRKK